MSSLKTAKHLILAAAGLSHLVLRVPLVSRGLGARSFGGTVESVRLVIRRTGKSRRTMNQDSWRHRSRRHGDPGRPNQGRY